MALQNVDEAFDYDAVKSEKTQSTPEWTDLKAMVEKSESDRITYYDPIGWKTKDGNPIDLREKMYEKGNWEEKFQKINELAEQGQEVELKDAVKSALSTQRVSLPVFTVDQIFISDEEDQPLVDGLARVAVDTNEIRLDEVSEIAEISTVFDEGTDVNLVNDTIDEYQYTIYGVGIRKQVTDKLVHTERYNPEQLKTELARKSIDRYKEAQALQGTEYDPNGYEGLADWVQTAKEFDYSGKSQSLDQTVFGQLVTELEVTGANKSDLMAVTDHRSFNKLRRDLDQFQRYQLPDSGNVEVSFGASAITVDGVLVNKTHGTPSSSGSRQAYVFDASGHAWYHLSDTTVKPLAPTPHSVEQMLVYEYVTFGSEARNRIARAIGLGN